MIIDMHVHTKSSLDSPATAEDYCKAIKRFKKYHPFDGIVLTEHRVYNEEEDEEYQNIVFFGKLLIFLIFFFIINAVFR